MGSIDMANKNKRGGLGMLITIAYRNIYRNMRRTAFCLCAVGVAVFFIVFYQAFIDGMTKSINEVVQVFDTGHVKVVSSLYEKDNEYLPVQFPVSDGESADSLVQRIKALDGVREVFPRISCYATLQESVIKHALLWGLRAEDETRANNFNLTDRSNGLVEGRFPRPDSN